MHLNNQEPSTKEANPVEPANNVPNEVPRTIPPETVAQQDETQVTPSDETTPETPDETKNPEWFMKDKFKSIDEQAKSYKELSTKMGKYWGSPQEGYKVDGLDGIEDTDPLIAGLTPALKEMGISQDGFNHLVTQYMEANKQMMKSLEDNLRKTLTETDAHTYQSIEKWMNDNLTPEESSLIKNNWLMSADDFKILNHLRLMAAPSTNVPSGVATPAKFESSKEVTNEKTKYKNELKAGTRVPDKNFENELAARFRDAAARELRNKGR